MRRRDFCKNIASAAVTSSMVSHLSCGMPGRKQNVIVIMADDLGYGDLGCYGNPIVHTPSIDSIAENGMRLTRHYCGSPLCAPSRAAFLTGRYNHRTGAVDVPSNRGLDRIALDERTIGAVMHDAGYRTGMFGKWHNGVHDMRYHPNNRGFDEFIGFLNGGMDYWQWQLDHNGETIPHDGRYLTDVFSAEAVNFIIENREDPFFLFVSYNAPHGPFQAPEGLVSKYKAANESMTGRVATIYAMIERMDQGIGTILDTVEKLKLAQDTIVLFTSDNGPLMNGPYERYNGPFRGQKGDVLEGGIRVPAIIRWPQKIAPGSESEEIVHFIDWLPTLMDCTGVRETGGHPLDGSTALKILTGGTRRNRAEFWYWQRNRYEPVWYSNAAVIDGRWKLYWPDIPEADTKLREDNTPYFRGLKTPHTLRPIDLSLPERDLSPPQPPRLYDVIDDPGETNNLAQENQERVATMKDGFDEWFNEVLTDWRQAREDIIDE